MVQAALRGGQILLKLPNRLRLLFGICRIFLGGMENIPLADLGSIPTAWSNDLLRGHRTLAFEIRYALEVLRKRSRLVRTL